MFRSPSHLKKRLVQPVAFVLLAMMSNLSIAQWRYVAVSSEAVAMRFNTIHDAHDFMVDYLIEREQAEGVYRSDRIYPASQGRYVSEVCFVYNWYTGSELGPDACELPLANGVYRASKFLLPAEMENTPFLNRDLGLPSTAMCVGNPIHLGTGNKFQAELDYQSTGTNPIAFARYYNSSLTAALMGGWSHTYARSVDFAPATYGENMVVLHRAEGQQLAFYAVDGEWLPTWKTDDRLVQTRDGWQFTQSNGVIEGYNDSGQLVSIEQPDGNVIQVTHTNGLLASVVDSFGRTLTFQHSGGRISGMVDPAGEIIQFQYDPAGRLGTVVYQDGASRSYVYDKPEAPGLLSGIIDENGNRFATWTYDAQGRAVSSEHSGQADRTTVDYNPDGTVDVTNALGHVQTYTFMRRNGALKVDTVEGAPCTGFAGGFESRDYDSKGMLTGITDRSGQKRPFRYSDRGLNTSRVDQDGATITTTWHDEYALPLTITSPESVTSFTYDERLRLTGTAVSERYSTGTRTWTYTYHPDGNSTPGLLATVDGPRTDVNDVTSFAYDGQGNLTSTINALGQVTQYQNHDAHGRPQKITGPNGVIQILTFDLRGRLQSATGPEGTTTYTFDDVGLLSTLTKPNGVVVSYVYDDAHRLIETSDALGNKRTFERDGLGNVTTESLFGPAGQIRWTELREFNEIGWLTGIKDAFGNQTLLGYDVVANLVEKADPSGDAYTYGYDGFHHQTTIQDPLGESTQIIYEDTGEIYRVSDPRSRRTYYEYNGFGETIEVRNPDTGTTTFTYDEAGNVATRTDAKGQVVSYTYDALNRLVLVSSSLAGDPDIQYGYDDPAADYGIGRLTSVDDGNGVRTFDYTPEGWLAAETWTISGQVLTTSYQYDGAGLIEQITYPSGRTVVYGRNAAGEVSSVSTTEGGTATSLATQIERAPFGPVTAMTHGNGLAETRTLDLNYRTTAISVPGVHSLSYSYTPDSNIADINDLLTPSLSQSLSYDAVDRLIGADGLYGLLDYTYDATGNRTSFTADGVNQTYNLPYSNNWLLKAGAVTNTYDDNGNMVDRGGDVFTYDSFNRLVGASVGGSTALYTYNHLDQRVTKTLNGHTRLLLYDQTGNLIAEMDAATGNVLAEYIWLDGTPLAFVQSGQTYHVHVDHLGTPKALTDSADNIAWEATHSPFGKASITSQGPTFNLRFPGQYYDAETGLHYNWRRYYDPETGRYITSDPIGLAGGINTYAYALSNPIGNADPTGEFVPLLLGAYAAVEVALSAWDAYDTYQTITSDCSTTGEKWAAGGLFAAGVFLPGNYGAIDNVAKGLGPTVGELRRAKLKDAHHIIQDAAVRDLPGYKTNAAPGVQLPGGGRGTPHHAANQVQKQRGGGTYADERRIGYKALRRAGLSKQEARRAIGRADSYFESIGVTSGTKTRIPRRYLPRQ